VFAEKYQLKRVTVETVTARHSTVYEQNRQTFKQAVFLSE